MGVRWKPEFRSIPKVNEAFGMSFVVAHARSNFEVKPKGYNGGNRELKLTEVQ